MIKRETIAICNMKKLIDNRFPMEQYCTYNFSFFIKNLQVLIRVTLKSPCSNDVSNLYQMTGKVTPFSKKGGFTKFENYRAIMGLSTISQILESKRSLSGLKPLEIFNIKL